MKRILLYIGIALAVIGCTKDADVTQSGGNVLTITSNIATRVANDQWEENDAVGVYITSSLLGDEGENVMYITEGGDGNFTTSSPFYLQPGGEVGLFAYYPWVDGVNLEAYPIDSEYQVDLLSASKSGVTASSNTVVLTFDHLLSKVSLTIEPGDGLTDDDLKGLEVSLSGISTTATFDLLVGNEATTTNSAAELLLTTSEDGTSLSVIVIPQELDGATLSFTTNEYGTFSATLSTLEFEVGKEYIYTATLNRTGVEITSSNIENWDENIDTGIADIVDIEYKTSDGKYHINSAKGLAAFRDLVNGSTNTDATFAGFEKDTYNGGDKGVAFGTRYISIDGVLTRDIDITDVCGTSWTPIGIWISGEGEKTYAGTFDGGGHEISGLIINNDGNQQGLFRYIGINGVVCNLGVSGSATNNKTANFNGQLGGLTAYNAGTIVNCYSTVVVKGDYMCNVGGIAAYSSGSVVNCYNHGEITGLVNIGGIVGKNDGSDGYVGYCYNTGKVSSSIANAENGITQINIEGDNDNPFTVKYGGVVGYNSSTHSVQVKGSFCLNNTDYSVGQVAVNTSSGTLNTNVCDEDYLTSETFATTMNNGAATYNTDYNPTFTACAWIYNANSYPTHDFGTSPTKKDLDINYNSVSYNIYTAKGLQAFAALVNGDSKPDDVSTSGNDIYFEFGTAKPKIDGKLSNDIDLKSAEWTPIGDDTNNYSGTFDGGGKTISGLYINSDLSGQGLFGYVSSDGVVNGLTVEGDVYSHNNSSATSGIAGIVAYNYGLIINCCNHVNVSGNEDVGGVAGNNLGTVANCCNHGAITGLDSGGSVGGSNVGGLVGQNPTGFVYYVYNAGLINDGTSNGGTNIGSVIGYNNNSTASGCYTLNGATSTNYIFGDSSTTYTNFIKDESDMKGTVAFVNTLNANVSTYNVNESNTVQAYIWTVVSDDYPVHVYGSTSVSTDE